MLDLAAQRVCQIGAGAIGDFSLDASVADKSDSRAVRRPRRSAIFALAVGNLTGLSGCDVHHEHMTERIAAPPYAISAIPDAMDLPNARVDLRIVVVGKQVRVNVRDKGQRAGVRRPRNVGNPSRHVGQFQGFASAGGDGPYLLPSLAIRP